MRSILHGTLTTGCSSLDTLLEGGIPKDGVTLVYGEAETGKTSLGIQCAVYSARKGFKTLYVDSDSTFSGHRLAQIAYRDSEEIAPMIILMRPTTFKEQSRVIECLDEYLSEKFSLVVVDTITSLYRVSLEGPKETFKLNRELNSQVASLAELARNRRVGILIVSQVRSVFFEVPESVEPVATRTLKFWSDIVLSLKRTSQTRIMKVTREKHPTRKRPASCYVSIQRTGMLDYGH